MHGHGLAVVEGGAVTAARLRGAGAIVGARRRGRVGTMRHAAAEYLRGTAAAADEADRSRLRSNRPPARSPRRAFAPQPPPRSRGVRWRAGAGCGCAGRAAAGGADAAGLADLRATRATGAQEEVEAAAGRASPPTCAQAVRARPAERCRRWAGATTAAPLRGATRPRELLRARPRTAAHRAARPGAGASSTRSTARTSRRSSPGCRAPRSSWRPSWPAPRRARTQRPDVLAQLFRSAARRTRRRGGRSSACRCSAAARSAAILTASLALPMLLDEVVRPALLHAPRTDRSSTATARGWRAPAGRAAPGVYVAERLIDLPGRRCSCASTAPPAEPQPDPQPGDRAGARAVARARSRWCCCWRATCGAARAAEHALAEALAFRKAMEDSLLDRAARARPRRPHHLRQPGVLRDGRLQRGRAASAAITPPYWPPEMVAGIPPAPAPAPHAGWRCRRPRQLVCAATRARASRPTSCARTASASR